MDIVIGSRVVTTKSISGYPAGTRGQVIRIDTAFFAADRYAVLLEDGSVLEQLVEVDLFATDTPSADE